MTKLCVHCDEEIDTDEWYPVTTERDDAGNLEIYDFCSERCERAWSDGSSD